MPRHRTLRASAALAGTGVLLSFAIDRGHCRRRAVARCIPHRCGVRGPAASGLPAASVAPHLHVNTASRREGDSRLQVHGGWHPQRGPRRRSSTYLRGRPDVGAPAPGRAGQGHRPGRTGADHHRSSMATHATPHRAACRSQRCSATAVNTASQEEVLRNSSPPPATQRGPRPGPRGRGVPALRGQFPPGRDCAEEARQHRIPAVLEE